MSYAKVISGAIGRKISNRSAGIIGAFYVIVVQGPLKCCLSKGINLDLNINCEMFSLCALAWLAVGDHFDFYMDCSGLGFYHHC